MKILNRPFAVLNMTYQRMCHCFANFMGAPAMPHPPAEIPLKLPAASYRELPIKGLDLIDQMWSSPNRYG